MEVGGSPRGYVRLVGDTDAASTSRSAKPISAAVAGRSFQASRSASAFLSCSLADGHS